jgi:hypothetical protein
MTEVTGKAEWETGITINFQKVGGVQQTVLAEALIIACEPANLKKVMKFSSNEESVFSSFKSYTFHTTLVEVDVPAGGAPFGIILKPQAIDDLSGAICGYRNESAKTYSLDIANTMEKNLVTIYQLRKTDDEPWTSKDFLEELRKVLPQLDWWPYGNSFEWHSGETQFQSQLTTRYFDHFDDDGLAAEMPWKYLALQGENKTFYVHASTCFESVLQCYQYIEKLFNTHKSSLPADTDAPIGILGAGVSGLLAAHFLKNKHHYTNVTLYEISDRIGGKTVTLTEPAPKPEPSCPDTACELGTCYLSPAYDDMVHHLKKYFDGNAQLFFRRQPKGAPPDGKSFRGIVTEGQFKNRPELPAVVGYQEFAMLKGMADAGIKSTGDPKKDSEVFAKATVKALEAYCKLHESIMGCDALPMPSEPPLVVISGAQSGSFYAFLERNNLLVLTGLLEYAYSVQGYGPLHKIPAYYGLIWISVPLVKTIIESFVNSPDKALVTYLENGWLDVWHNMAKDFDIRTGMIATDIKRMP